MILADEVKNRLSDKALSIQEKTKDKFYIEINPEDLKSCAEILFNGLRMRLITASGTDARRHIEILYHFTDDNSGQVFSLRVFLKDKKDLSIDSLAPMFKGAEWIEREIHELLGVNFKGHPNLKHLLLSDDWPGNNFPLRHDNERK